MDFAHQILAVPTGLRLTAVDKQTPVSICTLCLSSPQHEGALRVQDGLVVPYQAQGPHSYCLCLLRKREVSDTPEPTLTNKQVV